VITRRVPSPEPDPRREAGGAGRVPPGAGAEPQGGRADAAPAWLVVGRVLRPHGLRGEVVVEVLSDAEDRFEPGARLAAGDPDAGQAPRQLTVTAAHRHQRRLLLRFAGLEDRDAVEGLRGVLLTIPASQARALGPGEFWPYQLVGLAVVDAQGRRRGTVEEVVPGAANDLLSVRLDPGPAVLVPAVQALVTVDLQAARVVVADLPGLLDPP
jgi:16S rRNA processing protein RimM